MRFREEKYFDENPTFLVSVPEYSLGPNLVSGHLDTQTAHVRMRRAAELSPDIFMKMNFQSETFQLKIFISD